MELTKQVQAMPGDPSMRTQNNPKLSTRPNGESLRVLSEADWKFWIENGYVIIKNAISKKQAADSAAFIWEFEGKDPTDKDTWYRTSETHHKMKELNNSGMVEVYNHQVLWNNRQSERIHQAFADIWDTEKLWVSIDRANLNFPVRPGYEHKGFIHWDYDPETKPQYVQGVLALADQTDENMGGFQCIPELFRTYDTWKLTQPEDRNRFMPDTTGFTTTKVKMEAGDLMIFNSSQPHGIRPNHSDKVRVAQYITMIPADENNEALKQWRVNAWHDRLAPVNDAYPGDPLQRERNYPIAELSELGKKVLGLQRW
jgi:ectoine hydroxylase-related dioxygenase (phytanoyl-CoA dioxygenase family)